MMTESPIEYKINYVRVYQDPNDPKQKVGCSTPERPTRKFIQAHEKKYKLADDVSELICYCTLYMLMDTEMNSSFIQDHPLKPIQNGGGPCIRTPDVNNTNGTSYCGGPSKGFCQSKLTCKCLANWTGPHCTNPVGFDDIIWDPPESWADIGFTAPSFEVLSGGMVVLSFLVFMLVVSPLVLRKRRQIMGGWTPVGSVDYERRVGV
jgi:hypothetical protein